MGGHGGNAERCVECRITDFLEFVVGTLSATVEGFCGHPLPRLDRRPAPGALSPRSTVGEPGPHTASAPAV